MHKNLNFVTVLSVPHAYQVAVPCFSVIHLFSPDDPSYGVYAELVGEGRVYSVDIESIIHNAIVITV